SSSISRLFCTTLEIRWWHASRGYRNLLVKFLLMPTLKHLPSFCQRCNVQNNKKVPREKWIVDSVSTQGAAVPDKLRDHTLGFASLLREIDASSAC
ncbi:MAG: hypothetical protein JJT96_14355, partial [Opitutales bacterium]|nr:hypothetical protein [Opitutales bacterium]